jgi:HK97 gp10 family phage protein
MSFKLDGTDQLMDDLAAMAARLDEDGPTCNGILESAAAPIHQQMKANASSDPKIITGALHRSIKVGRAKKRKTGRSITIGVHHSSEGAFYANPVEFGHGGPAPAPAHPFVRPAYDTKSDESYDIIRAGLRDAISRNT